MSRFESILEELNLLESQFKGTVNRLWAVRSNLKIAHAAGHRENDFLPRRLQRVHLEEKRKLDLLIMRLNLVISTRLDSAFIAFSSVEDVRSMVAIRRSIRYIRNAFANELHLGYTLNRLDMALAATSQN